MMNQGPLKIALLDLNTQAEEVEVVGVFENLQGQIGLWCWQGAVEVGDGLALPVVQIALDLMNENIPTPAVLDGLTYVEFTLIWLFYFV